MSLECKPEIPVAPGEQRYASKSMTLSETSLASELRQTLKELLAGSGLLTALS